MTDDEEIQLLGFFTLALKSIDISQLEKSYKKMLVQTGKSIHSIDHLPAILIAQFGKNDRYSSSVSGEEMMSLCLSYIEEVRKMIGTKLVILDSVNHPSVIRFYKQYGFQEYGEIFSAGESRLQPMVRVYDDLWK